VEAGHHVKHNQLHECRYQTAMDSMTSSNMKTLSKDTLRQVLSETKGNRTEAAHILKQAGYSIDRNGVSRIVDSDPELTAKFPSTNRPDGTEPPAAPSEAEVTVRAEPPAATMAPSDQVAIQDEALKEQMRGANFTEDQIQRFGSYSDFIAHGFARTVDCTYGVMVKGVMQLEERANWIHENILCNEENEEAVDEHGNTVVIPKYSNEDKLQWQKEYLSIMDQIGKYATVTNNAALIRVKAHAADAGKGDKRQKRMKKVKRRDESPNVTVAPASK